MKQLWRLREGVAEAVSKAGAVYKYDISLPLKDFYTVIEDLSKRIPPPARVMGYGHVGDGKDQRKRIYVNILTSVLDRKLAYQRGESCV